MAGVIRTGIGGWAYPPWRGLFYPKGTRQADELAFASAKLGAIEINVTFQSFQTPATFARWAAMTPEAFTFTVKAHRLCTNRKVLADAGEAVERFMGQGLVELGERLGPILWQMPHTKAFDPVDFAAFLDLLPRDLAGRRARHAVEVRHPSFVDPRLVDLCRARDVAICLLDHPDHRMIDEATADFAYARLIRGRDEIETGYPADALDLWAGRLRDIATGEESRPPRDAFAFFINAGKRRAPAAATALARRLEGPA
jgi:uncharacterized protein YecE (DUF72 family)